MVARACAAKALSARGGGTVIWTPTRRELYDSKQPNIQVDFDMIAINKNGFVSWQPAHKQQASKGEDLDKSSADGKNDKSSSSPEASRPMITTAP